MLSPRSASEILDRQFLETRALILRIAADLDRLDRAEGALAADPRLEKLHRGIEILKADAPNRAEQVQLLFSREYNSNWKEQLGVSASS